REQAQRLGHLRMRLTESADLRLQGAPREPFGFGIRPPLGAHAREKAASLGNEQVGRLELGLASLEGGPPERLGPLELTQQPRELGEVQDGVRRLQMIASETPLPQSPRVF